MGRQGVDRTELGGDGEELVDLGLGVQPWWSSCLRVPEVPRRRHLVSGIVKMELCGELAHSLVPPVALRKRRPLSGPRDDRRCPDLYARTWDGTALGSDESRPTRNRVSRRAAASIQRWRRVQVGRCVSNTNISGQVR